MNLPYRRGAVALAVVSLGTSAFSQQGSTPNARELPPVTITGNPLGATELVAPAVSYSGPALLLRSAGTLGETLNNTPGVSSTYFGPNASRPVIRGLDGDRIRILSNSGASLDVSSLSFDHAVTVDPISIERIEVLRGPAALLYGGNAIGGVVNVIDNRIPREPLQGVSGKADIGIASANRERGGGLAVDGGTGRIGLHVDVFRRNTEDVRVPVALECTRGGVTSVAHRICNSASAVRGGAVGGSTFFDNGYLGAAVSQYRNDYGSVAEDEVTIGMRSKRYAFEGEARKLQGPFQSIKGQFSHTDYRHTEFDAGQAGTVFSNQGNDFRLEARHVRIGPLDGVIGLQAESNRFAADGSEAFAPYSRTRQAALFAYEEMATSWGKVTFGARTESVRVESLGNPTESRFTADRRQFRPVSYSLGSLWNMAPEWQLTGNLAYSERAPKDYELYANGPHLATAAYEVGDRNLGKEKSTNAELAVQWKEARNFLKVGVFASQFRNYIALQATGAKRELEDGSLPEFSYSGVRARFRGLEASGNLRLQEGPSSIDLEMRSDLVRASNLSTGEPLPRIAPARIGATLIAVNVAWGARLGFDRAARQSRVPSGERAVDGYTLWSAAVTYRMKAGPTDLLWFARLDNATDRLAYSASSILTQTTPGKSPLPGRSLKLGLQAHF